MASAREQFDVGGMNCSFCASSIRKAYGRTAGVEEVDVSLAHEEVLVRYDDETLGEVELKDTLRDLGFTIRDPDRQRRFEEQQAELARGRRRLLVAGGASLAAAGLMGWMVVATGRFESESLAMDLGVLGLAVGTVFGPGRYIAAKAYHSLRRGIFNQHVLLEAGAFAGLVGGLLGLSVFPGFPSVHFFAVSVFITTYHVLSEYTSLLVRTRAARAVRSLLDLRADTARRVTAAGDVEEVDVDELAVGERVRVKPGETVPVDGEVVDGESTVDESVVTGESMPAEKGQGDAVVGGSINRTGSLLVEVRATSDDAFLNRVAREVEEARARRPDVVQIADRVLRYFVPGVLGVAALAFAFWTVAPAVWGTRPAVQRGAFAALAVLVLGYPCALGMATPLALIRGGGRAASRGILLRSGDAFQVLPVVDHVVFDKTGTLTVGEPSVADVVAVDGNASGVLATAASAEAFSEHPLADAILEAADARGVAYSDPESFDSVTGKGVAASVHGDEVMVGKPAWLAAENVDLSVADRAIERLRERGLTAVGVARAGALLGLVGIGDEPKADAAETVRRIEQAGLAPAVLTGDDERTARSVAETVGIDRVLADVHPDEKRAEIARLQDSGHSVAMVGDGINDAPALTQADVGLAVGAGTDVAIESADVVLTGDRLAGVVDAREIAAASYRKTKQNLAVAFSFNGAGVAAATTGLVHPVFAMIAMVLSVSAVLANSFAGSLAGGDADVEHGGEDAPPGQPGTS